MRIRRYITKSLEEENASYSYVGVFLRKEYSVLWIAQLKEILRKCNTYLKNAFAVGEDTKTTKMSLAATAAELQNLMIILLHTMVSFTSVNTWRIFNSKNFRADNLGALKPSLNHLCNNVVGFLIQQDFYFTLRVSYTYISWQISCAVSFIVIFWRRITMSANSRYCERVLHAIKTRCHNFLRYTDLFFVVCLSILVTYLLNCLFALLACLSAFFLSFIYFFLPSPNNYLVQRLTLLRGSTLKLKYNEYNNHRILFLTSTVSWVCPKWSYL